MIAPGAFIRYLFDWMEVSCPIWTGLDAIGASNTMPLVNKHYPLLRYERCTNRAYLDTPWVSIMIAELRDKECLVKLLLFEPWCKTLYPSLW
jgi:hypothetical protein